MNTNHKVSDIARALSLSERRVQQLVREEVLPAPVENKYDLAGCIKAYGQYLLERQISRTGTGDMATEKLRLLKAQAEKAELELDILKGKYLEASEVEFSWSNIIVAFRSRMLAIPSKLVRQLASAGGDFARIERTLADEIHEALSDLSRSDDEEYEDNQKQVGTTSEADCKSVG